MKVKLFGLLIAVLLLTIVFSGCSEKETTNKNSGAPKKEIGFIQNLINNASEGDTINIPSGTYYENVIVNKSIKLIGENKDTTIIYGNTEDSVVVIEADYVTIANFTIQNSDYGYGIELYYRNNNTITNNDIKSIDNAGVYLEYSSDNIIKDNILTENRVGIDLAVDCYRNDINDNEITSHIDTGICLGRRSSNNFVTGNKIDTCKYNGILITIEANDNILSTNIISNCYYGIDMDISSENNIITNNNLSSNDIFGIAVEDNSSNNNIIYSNNFIGNSRNAHDMSDNHWDNGAIGNYWSDYTGIDNDSDGVGDTPYNIEGEDNKDSYPLMNPVDI